jgi:predicted transposase YbfD/YdcC
MQVKGNQKLLLADCEHVHQHLSPKYKTVSYDKGHGRAEQRKGMAYLLNAACLNSRWSASGVHTLVVVERERTVSKTNKISTETSYWISNMPLNEANFIELFTAVRQHWSIEVHHNYRDKQLGEDNLVSRNENQCRFMSTCITLAMNLLKNQKTKNMTVLRETLSQQTEQVYQLFEDIKLL